MKFLSVLLFIFLIGSVSAYSHCVGDVCCDDDGYVICNPSNPDVCGESDDWCDNFNNPSLSCMYNDPDWCCNNGGSIIDYSSKRCCPPDYPFHSTDTGSCWKFKTPTSDNYYTRLHQCDYIYNPATNSISIEETCSNYDFKICERNGISQWVNGWDNKGATINKCGVNCLTGSDCPPDEISDNYCNLNQIVKTTVQHSCSNYNCISSEKTEVVETCSLSCEMIEPEEQLLHMFTVFRTTATATCVGCTDNEIILLDKVYYICRNNNLEPVLDLVEFSDAEQQALLDQIHLLNLSVEEQLAIVANLELTLAEKKLLAANLQLELDDQILLVGIISSNLDEQIAIANSLNLDIAAQNIMIQELTDNLAEKLYWLDQLKITNAEQGILLAEMRLNFADQLFILNNLNNTIQEDAIIIENLNLSFQNEKRLLVELQITHNELLELMALLDLSLNESVAIIADLRLTLEEEQLMVSQLTDKIEKQNELLALLQSYKSTPSYLHFWEDYKMPIIIVGFILFLLIIGGGRKK